MANKIAYIREAECIGCIKCIKACSDNAILGARKQLHTILTDLCTGCEDCIAVCPVDCIEMIPVIASAARQSSIEPGLSRYDRNDDFVRHDENKKQNIADAIKRTLERKGWKNDTTQGSRDL